MYVVKEPGDSSNTGLFFSEAHASVIASATPSTPFHLWISITSAPLRMSVTDNLDSYRSFTFFKRKESFSPVLCSKLVLRRLHSTVDYPYCSSWFGESFHTRPRLTTDVGHCQNTFPSSVSADPWGAFRSSPASISQWGPSPFIREVLYPSRVGQGLPASTVNVHLFSPLSRFSHQESIGRCSLFLIYVFFIT